MNKFIILTLCLTLTAIASANGLVINTQPVNFTKIDGTSHTFQVNITNTEPFKFYNITIDGENAKVNKFNLESGETKIVTVNYTGNSEYEGQLVFRGQYKSNLGQSNQTQIVNIDYDTGFDACNLNLIIGDSITWVNNVNDYIKLVDADSGQQFQTILENENMTKTFDYPETIRYYATRITKFTNICTIEIMGDEDFAHSYEYDAMLEIDVKITYPETQLEATLLETNYTIEYGSSKEDILKLKNGNKLAKVKISSDWIDFTPKTFDIQPNESKNVAYKIKPKILDTNSTNKTYNLNITIEGNFPTINKQINVFVPYHVVTVVNDVGEFDPELLRNTFLLYCSTYPEDSLCVAIDSYGKNIDDNITQVISESTLSELLQRYATDSKQDTDFKKNQIETDVKQTDAIIGLNQTMQEMIIRMDENTKKSESAITTNLFIAILIIFLASTLFLYKIYTKKKLENPNKKKGELKW